MKHKKAKMLVVGLIILLLAICAFVLIGNGNNGELKSIKSEKQLKKIYVGKTLKTNEVLISILSMPFSLVGGAWSSDGTEVQINNARSDIFDKTSILEASADASGSVSESKDYSTTNIQVENVDEADITKTDGDYIYSISEDKVIITDVKEPENIKVVSTISLTEDAIPEDIILYDNKLVVIACANENTSNYYNNTIVNTYDIQDKAQPRIVKSYELNEPYYTSRCINGKLYVISSGILRKEDNKIVTYYQEDSEQKDIGLKNIKYLKDIKTKKQTIISMLDLNNVADNVKVNSYLIDMSNAYISENAIYLLNQKYMKSGSTPISSLFTLKGAIGPFVYESDDKARYKTDIYKFDIMEDGTIEYSCKTRVDGKTINQYSIDEYNNNLRVALYDNNGSRVVIFNEMLDKIGETDYLAKGETMYSSRFIGNKAYLVTYKTMDPLYVIDLSDVTEPQILGELKIPGYSTYLHPYDENYLIGIGMETKEVINKNSQGKVTSTTTKTIGMKMALFDVSDVSNPIQISSIVIGDSKTTSAILTNPKALLFSKEKELIAIPVNNYEDDFSVEGSENYETEIQYYTNYNKNRVSEGYFVYKINVEDGFKLKGVVTHDVINSKSKYSYTSKLLRGLYIDENLYTVSETGIKVNDLETLNLISELKIK